MKAAATGFRDGDRVCFIGDSITHTGTFHELVYLYQLTRYPGAAVTFWNCGRAGGVVHQVNERYGLEIAPLQPSCAAVMFGMNDCGRHRYGATRESPEDHASRRAHLAEFDLRMGILLDRLRADGCRIILQTPTPYDQTAADRAGFPPDGRVTAGREHANDGLARFAEWVVRNAPRWDAAVVDYHGPFTGLTLRLQQDDPAFSMTGDRVHPDPCWHLLAAFLFITQTGMAADLAAVRLDAAARRCDLVERSLLADLAWHDGCPSFTWTAAALPCPLHPRYAPALGHVPFDERLNREVLTVAGLPPGRFGLAIDGAPCGSFTAAEWAAGVNLAQIATTPACRQARALLEMNEARHELNVRLQDLNMLESWRAPGTSDADMLAQARAAAAQAAVPGMEWTAKVNQSYIDLFGRVEETRDTLRAMMAELNRRNRPAAHRCVICREGVS